MLVVGGLFGRCSMHLLVCSLTFYGFSTRWDRKKAQKRWGMAWDVMCLWSAKDIDRTGLLLGLYQASLRFFVIGFVPGYCEIRLLTNINSRWQTIAATAGFSSKVWSLCRELTLGISVDSLIWRREGWDACKQGKVSNCGQPGDHQDNPRLAVFKLTRSLLVAPPQWHSSTR